MKVRKVVHFAVVSDAQSTASARHRLAPCIRKIQNRKTRVRQSNTPPICLFDSDALVVRTAMPERTGHRLQALVKANTAGGHDNTSDSTHTITFGTRRSA